MKHHHVKLRKSHEHPIMIMIVMGFLWDFHGESSITVRKKIPEGKSSTRPSPWWKVNWEDFKLGDFLSHGQGQTPSLLEWFSGLFSSVSEILGMVYGVYGRSFFNIFYIFHIFHHFSSFSYWKMIYFMGILGSLDIFLDIFQTPWPHRPSICAELRQVSRQRSSDATGRSLGDVWGLLVI